MLSCGFKGILRAFEGLSLSSGEEPPERGGLFFGLFTGERPTYGVRGLYAYAAAPEWYLPRGKFTVVSLAPLVLLTLVGLVLMVLIPYPATFLVVAGLTFNAAGAVGDMFAAVWVLGQPAEVLVCDAGTAFTIYGLDTSDRAP